MHEYQTVHNDLLVWAYIKALCESGWIDICSSDVLQNMEKNSSENSLTTTTRKIYTPVIIIHLFCIHSFDIKLSGYKKLFPWN